MVDKTRVLFVRETNHDFVFINSDNDMYRHIIINFGVNAFKVHHEFARMIGKG